jgi:hypothetical protein
MRCCEDEDVGEGETAVSMCNMQVYVCSEFGVVGARMMSCYTQQMSNTEIMTTG